MPLPTSRNTTYAALSQVKSADLNDIQDWIINLWAGAHPEHSEELHASAGSGSNAATYNVTNGYRQTSGAGEWHIPIQFPPGTRIRRLRVNGDDTGGAITVQLAYTIGGVRTTVGSASGTTGVWAGAQTATLDHVMVAGRRYFARIAYDTTGLEFDGASVDVDNPV